MTGVPWTVTFRQNGDATYVASETTSQGFTLERRSYDSATIEFDDIRPANVAPVLQFSMFATNAGTGVPPLTEP